MTARREPPAARYDPADFPDTEFSPEVRAIFAAGGENARRTYDYLRYARALKAGGEGLEEMVAPDIQLHDLEAAGFNGLAGLKEFRRQRSAALLYDRAVLQAIRFPEPDVTDVDLCTERTEAATGRKLTLLIHARDRWSNRKVIERWHRPEELAGDVGCGPSRR